MDSPRIDFMLPLWVHKFGVAGFLPVGLCVGLMAVGLIWRRRWVGWLGVGVLVVASMPVCGDWALGTLEGAYPYRAVADCGRAEAAVVLGGYVADAGPGGRFQYSEAADRLETGLALVGAGCVETLVVTRGRRRDGGDEGELIRAEVLRRGVAAERVVVTEGFVENTAGEAFEVARLARAKGWGTVVVVTSAFHMQRAMWLMERAGVRAVAWPADWRGQGGLGGRVTDWVPGADGLRRTEMAMREWWGLAYYSLF